MNEWLFHNGMSIVTSIITIIVVYLSSLILRKDIDDLRKDIDDLRKDIDDLRKTVNKNREDMYRLIRNVREEINIIVAAIVNLGNYTPSVSTAGQNNADTVNIINSISRLRTASPDSPFSLTGKGLKIAKRINAQQLVDKYIERVRHKISNDAHKLNIQEVCFNYALNEFSRIVDSKEREIIWEAIYEEGGSSYEILIIYGVLFRNKILEERNIPVPQGWR